MSSPIQEIGRSSPRFDAMDKALGKQCFATDLYPKNMLWAGVKRAGVPHAHIKAVHTKQAEGIDGVFAVLTRKDVPGTNRLGIVHKDMPVLCGTKVRHAGDPVVLVLAENRETLRKALDSIVLDLEILPAVGGIDDALDPDAPLVHDEHPTGNVLLEAEVVHGDAKTAFAHCDMILEETFETPMQEHAFLETENGVARMDDQGILHMTVSTQAPFRDRFEIAHALGLDMRNIHISGPFLGGGFGGKDGATVQGLLALGAMHAKGRPVKVWWDREESFLSGYKRHAARMHYRLGATKDGTLKALTCRLYYDGGAYAHLGGEIMGLGLEHAAGPYRVPNMDTKGWCMYTNNPVGGAFRGFGVAQVCFAFEGMMDRLADRLGMCPLALRKKNALIRGDKNGAGITLTTSTGIEECLGRMEEHPLWRTRERWKSEAPRFKRRGVGISAVYNGMGYGRGVADYAVAKVRLTDEGHIRVYNGVSDMGQGNASTFVQIAGEVLCQKTENMELIQPDTARTHPSGSSAAGRTTYTYGRALIKACEQLRAKLINRAALVLFQDEEEGLVMVPGAIRHLASGRELPLSFLATMFPAEDRVCLAEFFMPVTKDRPDTGKAIKMGFPHLLFAYAAHLCRVEIDELTGQIDVKDYVAFTDGGRVLNPRNFEQQVQGSVAQGLGYALWEDFKTNAGTTRTRNLSTYIIPSSLDLPEIQSIPVETIEHTGPFGMKGIGEVGINGPLPAIASAEGDALGLRPTTSPVSREEIIHFLNTTQRENTSCL